MNPPKRRWACDLRTKSTAMIFKVDFFCLGRCCFLSFVWLNTHFKSSLLLDHITHSYIYKSCYEELLDQGRLLQVSCQAFWCVNWLNWREQWQVWIRLNASKYTNIHLTRELVQIYFELMFTKLWHPQRWSRDFHILLIQLPQATVPVSRHAVIGCFREYVSHWLPGFFFVDLLREGTEFVKSRSFFVNLRHIKSAKLWQPHRRPHPQL